MTWQIPTILAWLCTAQGINVLFAALCLWAAFGLSPRRMAVLSAVLYLALAFL